MTDTMIEEISIIEDGRTIFDEDIPYRIPLYQRAYAWSTTQIVQLIEDINDIEDNTVYYIGTLIVAKSQSSSNTYYEVVDGQQRLTTLFLLLTYLGFEVSADKLSFECRAASNNTLKKLKDICKNPDISIDPQESEESIKKGIKDISKKFIGVTKKNISWTDRIDIESFKEKLKRVRIYRIEVPPDTDLNRYFEIMNTRGEQLEYQDILKASLMRKLKTTQDRNIFSIIWDACSDMNGYVQMHFEKNVREALFDTNWSKLPSNSWEKLQKIEQLNKGNATKTRFEDFIAEDFSPEYLDENDDEFKRIKFESIIEFKFFLLHALKVYIKLKIQEDNYTPELLDDKKLLSTFSNVIYEGVIKNHDVAGDEETFSKEFLLSLLRTRFLFDKYIIKREYANDSSDGEWSLKELHVSGQGRYKKAYYSQTWLSKKGIWKKTNEQINKELMMLEAAMRVSYTSPKIMHWINHLLKWLADNNCANTSLDYISQLVEEAEGFIAVAINKSYLSLDNEERERLGVDTPHIVFNYLDYILWWEDIQKDDKKFSDFKFEFRNSVEHWYPQNPYDLEKWDKVDRFGNLCLVPRHINSRFSNMDPAKKKSTYEKSINKGSIKLRLMRDGTSDNYNDWKEKLCEEHEKEMLKKLVDNVSCFVKL